MAKYFKLEEFDSKDDPGSGKFMDPDLIKTLDAMREDCGFPFIVNSGVRTKGHNKEEGGSESSDHLVKYDGFAHGVDIKVLNGAQRFKLIQAALDYGIVRIGIGSDFVHLGNWIGNPQNVIWTY